MKDLFVRDKSKAYSKTPYFPQNPGLHVESPVVSVVTAHDVERNLYPVLLKGINNWTSNNTMSIVDGSKCLWVISESFP